MVPERRVLLLCLVISLVVWLFVKLSKSYETRTQVLLEYQLPMGYRFSDVPSKSLEVSLSGTGWELLTNAIFRHRPKVAFSLSGSPKAEIERNEIIRKIEEKIALNVTDLSQDHISVAFDSVFSRKVKVVLDSAISFQNGYFIRDSISLTPDSIVIFGPAKLLEGIFELKTEKLAMSCPEKNFRKTLKINNPQPDLFEISTTETEVFIPVEQYSEKTVAVPVRVVNSTDSIRLVPAVVQLKCVVGLSRFKAVSAADFRVEADFSETLNTGGQHTISLSLARQPKWVHSAVFSPKAVEYLIIQ
ncbi:MAG: hypothetical protein HY842_02220 [Bacteroidetes bacterium]|nr:hypothetical protein [Bacteroidota bacterium]